MEETTTTTTTNNNNNKKQRTETTTTTTTNHPDDVTSPIHILGMVTMSAPTNIAVIKYWGKADATYNTPINSSISVTLDQNQTTASNLRAITTIAASEQFTHDRLWLNGQEDIHAATNKRFRACIDGVKALAVEPNKWEHAKFHVSSYNTFPTAAGLASSAAGYAALVAAMAQLVHARETFPGQLSTIARMGSGSACRSLYGGFVAWRHGSIEQNWNDSKAECIANEMHWPQLRTLILVVSDVQKDTSSTQGMKTSVETSELLSYRAQHVVPIRMTHMEQAIRNKDFHTFAKLTMQDSNQFHATCLDTYPPIFYMNDVSRDIVRFVTAYNEYHQKQQQQQNGDNQEITIPVAYTFDAGPNAVLYTLPPHDVIIGALVLRYFSTTSTTAPQDDEEEQNHNRLLKHCDAEFQNQVITHTLDPNLVQYCDARMKHRAPSSNNHHHPISTEVPPVAAGVKTLYYTRPGPGPQIVHDICNLDPKTGLNTYVPTSSTSS
jgi:diphosphomevalonate decarboxylase